jgi:hypothetical protein
MKIHQMKQLFKNEKYENLRDIINMHNNESESKVYKFIYNFSIHRYSQNQKAFVIRFTDNKNENEEYGTDSEDSQKGHKLSGRSQICKEDKLQSLNDLNQITGEEQEVMMKSLAEYATLSNINKNLQKIASVYRQEISDYSKIFGLKKEDASIYILI